MKLISLEKEFTKACKRHPNLKLLESQWRFDKELISKALQNISAIFPHYSRHDASHSKQIIVNIERLLGSKIKNLTATDMWLILESAYSHDIGMVVTNKQFEDMDTPEFSKFIKDIAADTHHDLQKFAEEWLESKAQLPTGSDSHAFLNRYIQLISEWYRKKHPENSAKIIRNPYKEIGLDSPRNELLPKRLFDCLASICHAHGKSFDETIKLPYSEAGMATEDCHPRYVAFLLRLGDLLDIDDNRFCPVMMRMSGASLPAESYAHYEKHKSIKHFRLDPDRIEIDVSCPSPESYEQAYQWFEWLKDEHHKISQNWNIIVPSKKLGKLATLSTPSVSIEPPYLTIENGKQPKFKVNEEAILRLLRSTGLYSTKDESIREILQNAVDSSLIAAWIKHKDILKNLNPASSKLLEIYKDYEISAELKQDETDPEYFWLTVSDKGTGISEQDLRYILEAGGSSKNKWKTSLIQEMPIWYRPSGNFGIGLQSLYLISDFFYIDTKSILTHEALKVTFKSNSKRSITIEKTPSTNKDYGATIKARIKLTGFPETIKFGDSEYAESLQQALNQYDFTRENSNLAGYEQLTILSAIHKFSEGSPLKITSNGNPITHPAKDLFFSKKENILIYNMRFSLTQRRGDSLFRGQPFDGMHNVSELFTCTADFYSHQASDFLSYNREKILPQAKSKAIDSLLNSAIEYVEEKFNVIPDSEKPTAAAYHFLESDDISPKYPLELMKLEIHNYKNKKITLSEIISAIEKQEIKRIEIHDPHRSTTTPPTEKDTFVLASEIAHASKNIIINLLQERGFFWQEDTGYSKTYKSIIISTKDIQPVSDTIFKQILNTNNRLDVGNRILFPVWGDYRDLALEATIPWARAHWREGKNVDYMVLPCKFNIEGKATTEYDIDLINWAYQNRRNKKITSETFHETYSKLIQHLALLQE